MAGLSLPSWFERGLLVIWCNMNFSVEGDRLDALEYGKEAKCDYVLGVLEEWQGQRAKAAIKEFEMPGRLSIWVYTWL